MKRERFSLPSLHLIRGFSLGPARSVSGGPAAGSDEPGLHHLLPVTRQEEEKVRPPRGHLEDGGLPIPEIIVTAGAGM